MIELKKYVLKTNNLKKVYHGMNALDDVSITLETGKIYGLIGQNGAGKSTLMRMIAGLSFPTEGTIELFGHTGEKELQKERRRMGTLIEQPTIIPNMTAKESLRHHRIMKGIPDEEIEDELLEFVGLSNTGKKKAKSFSLGMKQRLGIAMAMLSNPEFLILDEPINGLDPLGVISIRNLLKKLCEEKYMTILISSHNLPELYQTATDFIIIHKGLIKECLTLEQLLEVCRNYILIRCNKPEKLVTVLENELRTNNFKVMPDKSIKLFDYIDDIDIVAEAIYKNDIMITGLSNEGDTLENYFLSIIGGDCDA